MLMVCSSCLSSNVKVVLVNRHPTLYCRECGRYTTNTGLDEGWARR